MPRFGVPVVERAADRAVQTGADSYRALQAFCQAEAAAVAPSAHSPRSHDNVRGSDYYADPAPNDRESAP